MKKNIKTILWLVFFIVVLGLGLAVNNFYDIFFKPNIELNEKESVVVIIPNGTSFDGVCKILSYEAGLISEPDFIKTARQKGYVHNVKPGRYRIKNNMSNNALVNMLRAGNQEPVRLVFNNVRTKRDLAERVADQVEFSADSLLKYLYNDSVAKTYGFTVQEFAVMFIPNTYEIYWNISPENFLDRMKREYDAFWNQQRIDKAVAANLTPVEVSILASIVLSETNKKDEMPKVAGLFINRLKRGMKLEADPTVKFAIGDFELQRILFRHLEVDSPYNTYKNHGLPPGPIYIPDIISIDAVLNYEKHDYIFMCAKYDFSGYHAFAKTNAQHEQNARKYHAALNRSNIK